MDTEDPTKRH